MTHPADYPEESIQGTVLDASELFKLVVRELLELRVTPNDSLESDVRYGHGSWRNRWRTMRCDGLGTRHCDCPGQLAF